jgi:hypothetical protein
LSNDRFIRRIEHSIDAAIGRRKLVLDNLAPIAPLTMSTRGKQTEDTRVRHAR